MRGQPRVGLCPQPEVRFGLPRGDAHAQLRLRSAALRCRPICGDRCVSLVIGASVVRSHLVGTVTAAAIKRGSYLAQERRAVDRLSGPSAPCSRRRRVAISAKQRSAIVWTTGVLLGLLCTAVVVAYFYRRPRPVPPAAASAPAARVPVAANAVPSEPEPDATVVSATYVGFDLLQRMSICATYEVTVRGEHSGERSAFARIMLGAATRGVGEAGAEKVDARTRRGGSTASS